MRNSWDSWELIRGYLPKDPGRSGYISREHVVGGTVTAAVILAAIFIAQPGARASDKIVVITWVLLLVSIAMFNFIRKSTLKLIGAHYNIYPIMAEIEEQDKARPVHVFTNATRASKHFLQLFYNRREKLRLTTSYNIDPVDLQKVAEDEGHIIPRLEAEQLAMRLSRRYPNLVYEILTRT